MASDSIDWYLRSIARVPLLTAAQEIQLGKAISKFIELRESGVEASAFTPEQKRIHKHGQRSFEKMYAANLRLVVSLARKYVKVAKTLDLMDLVQEGNLGLHRAVEKFDYSRGYKFSTYAYWWIRQAITRAISQSDSTIRMPINTNELLQKVKRFTHTFSQVNGTMPSFLDICKEFEIDAQELDHLVNVGSGCMSLHSKAVDDGSMLIDIIAAEEEEEGEFDEIEKQKVYDLVPVATKNMTDLNKEVVQLTFFKCPELSRTEIGKMFGISRERVRQSELATIANIKKLYAKRYGEIEAAA